jgi:hypothetical protein
MAVNVSHVFVRNIFMGSIPMLVVVDILMGLVRMDVYVKDIFIPVEIFDIFVRGISVLLISMLVPMVI